MRSLRTSTDTLFAQDNPAVSRAGDRLQSLKIKLKGKLGLGGKIKPEHAAQAAAAVAEMDPVAVRTRPLAARIWELRSNLTTYDAAYVAAAERYRCALVTTDARLARAAGIQCTVNVIP